MTPTEAAPGASEQRWHTPPQLAKMLGVEPAKIIGWINRGELRAVNVADRNSQRPRWRISPEAFEEFTRPRTSTPHIKPVRRQRPSGYVPKYYQPSVSA